MNVRRSIPGLNCTCLANCLDTSLPTSAVRSVTLIAATQHIKQFIIYLIPVIYHIKCLILCMMAEIYRIVCYVPDTCNKSHQIFYHIKYFIFSFYIKDSNVSYQIVHYMFDSCVISNQTAMAGQILQTESEMSMLYYKCCKYFSLLYTLQVLRLFLSSAGTHF